MPLQRLDHYLTLSGNIGLEQSVFARSERRADRDQL
jgi:hypothetical protein